MEDFECSGACLWGKRLVGDPGTQGGPSEFDPLILELWPKVFPAGPPLLLCWTPKGLPFGWSYMHEHEIRYHECIYNNIYNMI